MQTLKTEINYIFGVGNETEPIKINGRNTVKTIYEVINVKSGFHSTTNRKSVCTKIRLNIILGS